MINCLRWDYLNNMYERLKKDIDYLESLPGDDEARQRLFQKKIQLLQVEEGMAFLKRTGNEK